MSEHRSSWPDAGPPSINFPKAFLSPKFSNLQPPEPLFHFVDETCTEIPEAKTVGGDILPHVNHLASNLSAGEGELLYDPVHSK